MPNKNKDSLDKQSTNDSQLGKQINDDNKEFEEIVNDSADQEHSMLDELNDKYLRVLAEFDNFRKRTAKEKASMYDDGVFDTIAKFLPIIDNIERALGSATSKDDPLYKGVDMIQKQLAQTIIELNVEEISTIDTVFDPNQHFAVAHIEDAEKGENTIIEQLQKGYKYKNKVLRHSMVKVAN